MIYSKFGLLSPPSQIVERSAVADFEIKELLVRRQFLNAQDLPIGNYALSCFLPALIVSISSPVSSTTLVLFHQNTERFRQ